MWQWRWCGTTEVSGRGWLRVSAGVRALGSGLVLCAGELVAAPAGDYIPHLPTGCGWG